MCMNKIILEFPTFEEVKEALFKEQPDVIEITFKSQEDNAREFEIIYYLVNCTDYFFESLTPTDDSRTDFIAHFKRKS